MLAAKRRTASLALPVAVGWVILAGAGAARAQDPFADVLEMMKPRQQAVAGWLFDGRCQLALTLAIGALGIATGMVQKSRHAKRAAVGIGLAVSLLTLVKTTVFKNDHHAFYAAYSRGSRALQRASDMIADARTLPAENYSEIRALAREEIEAVDALADALDGAAGIRSAGPTRTTSLSLATPAYAMEKGTPPWVGSPPPSDKVYVWVVARGQGRTLQEAREAAAADSSDILERTFLKAGTVAGAQEADLSHYREALLATAVEESAHYDYDRERQSFTFYRLLRLRRETVETSVRFSAIDAGQTVSQSAIQRIQQAAPPPDVGAVPRASADMLLEATRQSLTDEDWRSFSDARYARLSGDYAQAVKSFESVVAEHPSAYLPLFNLGLTYDRLGRAAEAEAAYRRALALEPALPQRDAAVYNTYGYFLYRQRRYEEAIPLLERALALDPEHAKARRTLAAARQALVGPTP
jgi:tetratricopeptide (TPR) repeat protein